MRNQSTHIWNISPSSSPRVRLIFFPAAGSTSAQFTTLCAGLSPWIDCWSVEYAGRGRRWGDAFRLNLESISEELVPAIAPLIADVPTLLFGHSMGSLVGYECCLAIAHMGLSLPRALIASAHQAPQSPSDNAALYMATDEELLIKLRDLNGTPVELINDPEMAKMILKVFRADCRALSSYTKQARLPPEVRVTTYRGNRDKFVTRTQMEEWSVVAATPPMHREFPGDHFYINAQTALLAEILSRDALDAILQA